jgi:hypothetical protein
MTNYNQQVILKDELLDMSYWDLTPIPYKMEKLARRQMKEKGYYNRLEKEYITQHLAILLQCMELCSKRFERKKLIWSFV